MSGSASLLTLGLLLLANAFFVGAEFALISARRAQIEPLAVRGSRRAQTTLRAMEHVSMMLAGAQLGITAASLGIGAVGEPAVAHLLAAPFDALGLPEAVAHPVAFAIALTTVVVLHMVLGEMVPKNIALAGPERSTLWLSPLLFALVGVLRPVIWLFNAMANAVLRLLRVEPKDEVASAFTAAEVADLVAESRREGLLDADEHRLLTGALTFEDATVETVLLPVGSLVTVPLGARCSEVEQACARTGFSRFPVVDGSGGFVGYLHLRDVLEIQEEHPGGDPPVPAPAVRPLATLAVTAPLRVALNLMQVRGAHMARVVDSAGRLLGLVALEDVLERLVGEVRDATQRLSRPAEG